MRSLILLTTTSLFLAALALAGQGCVTVPAGPGGGIVAIPTVSEPKSYVVREGPAGNARPSKMDLGDPCSVRMQDMVGPIYEYYALHRRLPDNLEELRTVSDIEVDLNFTCPKSGKPYIYNPAGLRPQPAAVCAWSSTTRRPLTTTIAGRSWREWAEIKRTSPSRRRL